MVCRTDLFISWRKIVRAYSGLNLTKFEQDHLVALSGVAEEFSKALHQAPEPARKDVKLETNKYLCAVWRDDLVLSLQWQPVRKPGFCPTRVAGLPSWSGSRELKRVAEETFSHRTTGRTIFISARRGSKFERGNDKS
ncbi:hypothetical protein B0T11DRAFT_84022 [Plectosphaerella cucumerina]|uniref:Uncharacterized protein n=1 Tax=Plectosphaerella cucumerina TaxID=40658 RepID=A0A8K0TL71_9PEZI|nr:hypothetical protein B0T11DRAFT_84022 [Plectosphaerella cucumerina]